MASVPFRAAPILVLVFLVVLSGIVPPGAISTARAADATLVFAALKILVENHVDNPDPIRLLAAGANGLRQALTRAGISEVLTDLPADNEANARSAFLARLNQAVTLAQGKIGETQLQYSAIVAMVDSLETRSTFYTPEQLAERERSIRGEASFVGIGVIVEAKEGRVYCRYIIPGGPAARAGLRDFDRLLTVNGENIQGMTPREVSNRVRGAQGTQVTITVQRVGESSALSFSLTREPIAAPLIEHTVRQGGIGYIRFLRFTPGSAAQIRLAIEDMQRQGIRGLVLDFRMPSATGLFSELNGIAELMLTPGLPIYRLHTRQERRTQITRGSPVLDRTTPISILVDAGTGRLAALLAAAIQEHRRGVLIGVRTGPVGRAGQVFSLPSNAGIWVATARVTTGAGWDLEEKGVEPEIVVDLTGDDFDRAVDAQLQRAMQVAAQGNR